jgi:hypothetical protein
MSTRSNSTVKIEVQPPQTVHKSSAITPAVKAKLQFDSDSDLKGDEDNIFATAVVKDTNGYPIANGDYDGNMETRYQSKQTVGNKVNLTYTFPDLAIHKTGSFRIHISICHMDLGTGTVVLGHAESWILMVY